MEVVCVQKGIFSLSDQAIEMIMNQKGYECVRYIKNKSHMFDGVDEYKRCTPSEVEHIFSKPHGQMIHYCIKDIGEVVRDLPNDVYWYHDYQLSMNDKDLVSVVKKLGCRANGRYGTLVVKRI